MPEDMDELPADSDLVGTSWRGKGRRRKRRQLRVEKLLYSPREKGGGEGEQEGEEEEEGEGTQSSDDSESGSASASEDTGKGEGGMEEEIREDQDAVVEELGDEAAACVEDVTTERGDTRKTEVNSVSQELKSADKKAACVARQPAVYMPVSRDPEIQVRAWTPLHLLACTCMCVHTHPLNFIGCGPICLLLN